MAETMFQRLGGFATVSRIVSAFYDNVLESPILAPYFDGIDMRKQIDHQTKFFSALMGGPASYTDEELERRHARLNITEEASAELGIVLRETLEDFDLDDSDIGIVMAEITNRKRFVVSNS
jgi:hemoglobin